eukprot:3646016-Alexandrium_andersonii.AAC.1
MSASLVGSEMCIRDRLAAARQVFRGRRHPGGSSPAPASGKRTCLLYTSDATDDMQCVDLGGR